MVFQSGCGFLCLVLLTEFSLQDLPSSVECRSESTKLLGREVMTSIFEETVESDVLIHGSDHLFIIRSCCSIHVSLAHAVTLLWLSMLFYHSFIAIIQTPLCAS
jgi:hypothetical protein